MEVVLCDGGVTGAKPVVTEVSLNNTSEALDDATISVGVYGGAVGAGAEPVVNELSLKNKSEALDVATISLVDDPTISLGVYGGAVGAGAEPFVTELTLKNTSEALDDATISSVNSATINLGVYGGAVAGAEPVVTELSLKNTSEALDVATISLVDDPTISLGVYGGADAGAEPFVTELSLNNTSEALNDATIRSVDSATISLGVYGGAVAGAEPVVTELSLNNTSKALGDARMSLGVALECLQRCYSTEASANQKFRVVRAEVTKSTLMCRDLYLPFSSKIVSDLQQIFSFYEDMDAQTFEENIKEIAEEVSERAENAKVMTTLNVHFLTELNLHHKEAIELVAKLNLDHKAGIAGAKHIKKVSGEKSQYHAKKSENWAGGLIIVGEIVSVVTEGAANPLAAGAAAPFTAALTALVAKRVTHHGNESEKAYKEGRVRAIAQTEEALMALSAATMIQSQLMVALQRFIAAMEKITEFFSILEKDVVNYAENSLKSQVQPKRMFLYLQELKKGGKRIIQACDKYLGYVPVARAKIGALSHCLQDDIHSPNYIQKWLDEKLGQTQLSAKVKKQLTAP